MTISCSSCSAPVSVVHGAKLTGNDRHVEQHSPVIQGQPISSQSIVRYQPDIPLDSMQQYLRNKLVRTLGVNVTTCHDRLNRFKNEQLGTEIKYKPIHVSDIQPRVQAVLKQLYPSVGDTISLSKLQEIIPSSGETCLISVDALTPDNFITNRYVTYTYQSIVQHLSVGNYVWPDNRASIDDDQLRIILGDPRFNSIDDNIKVDLFVKLYRFKNALYKKLKTALETSDDNQWQMVWRRIDAEIEEQTGLNAQIAESLLLFLLRNSLSGMTISIHVIEPAPQSDPSWIQEVD